MMSATHSPERTEVVRLPAPLDRRLHWRRAYRALRAVIADPERTDQVIELINSIGGNADLRALARFRAHPQGQALLAERPSLLETLTDLDRLAALPAGSFGHAYACFMHAERLDPDGIVNEFRATFTEAVIDPDEQWFFERLDTMHDLWHVLTGYGRDQAGEAANLAFTWAQIPNRGVALLSLAAAALGPMDVTCTWQRYMYHAWRRGRRASWLLIAPYERLLTEPLVAVRRQLRIEPPEVAHPQGIIVGDAVRLRRAA
jgi:ubiquinone biosynthesis protein COQ4